VPTEPTVNRPRDACGGGVRVRLSASGVVAGAEEPFDGDVAFRVIVRPPPMVDVEPLQRPQEARRSELRSAVCSQLEEGEIWTAEYRS
jgi:hypothetical protein